MRKYDPYIMYIITKGNTNESLNEGDSIYFDEVGDLIVNEFLKVCELNDTAMDFEAEPDTTWFIYHDKFANREWILNIENIQDAIQRQLDALIRFSRLKKC